jgi:hypothetical protein
MQPAMSLRNRTICAFAIVLTASGLGQAADFSGPYRVEVLAQVGDVIAGQTLAAFDFEATSLAINNHREVAFFALVGESGFADYALLTQHRHIAGAGKVVGGHVPWTNGEDAIIDINDSGQVVYKAGLANGRTAVFVNDILQVATGDTIENRTLENLGNGAQINDAGAIVFDTFFSDVGYAVLSPTRILAESGQPVGGLTLSHASYPYISNNGQVAFWAGVEGYDTPVIATPDRIVLKQGDVLHGEVVDHFVWLSGINDAGEITMIVRTGSSSELRMMVATQERLLFRSGDVIDGQTVTGLIHTHVVMNDNHDVALIGSVQNDEGGGIGEALFAGGHLIAAEGDTLGGKTIALFDPLFDMNDNGDVAFRVEFTDGSRAVVLATVPEPASAILMLAAFAILAARRFQTDLSGPYRRP